MPTARKPPSKAPKKVAKKKPIEQYAHADKQRANNPHVGLVTAETDTDGGKRRYEYDPHLDPQLQWAGKAEHTAFEVPTVSLHVHERVDPKTILESVRRRNGSPPPAQMSLFARQPRTRHCGKRSTSTSTRTAGRTGSSPATRCWS
jgi:adenine-specific DNA-methyltransferase